MNVCEADRWEAPGDPDCPSAGDLQAFLSGELDEVRLGEVAAHLSGCSRCGELVQSLPDTSQSLREVARPGPFEHEVEGRRMIEVAQAMHPVSPQRAPVADQIEIRVQDDSTGASRLDATDRAPPRRGTQPTVDRPPVQIDRFEVRSVLGQGAFGQVLLAWDPDLHRLVALKTPRFEESSGEAREAFLKEARAAAQLRHPGIVTIYEVVRRPDGSVLIAMEYVDGQPLKSRLAAESLPPEESARIVAEAAEAIHAAHKRGLVHRDLKPANLLLGRDGQVRVADFGLAVAEDEQWARVGEFAGTPMYMPPEQVRGDVHHLDGRADIWSLGVILYEMLTGRRPFGGPNREVLLDEILNRDPKPLRQINDAIPAELERICLKCLARDATRRYSTAHDLASDLRGWNTAGRVRRPWSRGTLLAAAAVGALAVVAVVALPSVFAPPVAENKPPTGPANPPRPSIEPFIWQPLLSETPQEIATNSFIQERWMHDAFRRDVLADSRSYALRSLGETRSSFFKLRVDMSKSAAGGTAGLFYGFQSAPAGPGRQTWTGQTVYLNCRHPDRLRISHEFVEIVENADGTSSLNKFEIGSVDVPVAAIQGTTLELTVKPDRLHDVRWDGRTLDKLCGPIKTLPGKPLNCSGRFGLMNDGGSTLFSNAQVMHLLRN